MLNFQINMIEKIYNRYLHLICTAFVLATEMTLLRTLLLSESFFVDIKKPKQDRVLFALPEIHLLLLLLLFSRFLMHWTKNSEKSRV